MPRVSICVITGSRAEFGQLLPLLVRLEDDDRFELRLVVTGSHLTSESGSMKEIEASGLPIYQQIPLSGIGGGTQVDIVRQISSGVVAMGEMLNADRPDMVLLIGDRYEMFAAAIAAYTLLIPIAHICGGSVSMGALDEAYRHSMTKMSSLHFTTCDEYRRRVIQLGEDPSTVHNVGSLAIENCKNIELMDEREFRQQVGLDADERYCVVTYHPVTLGKEDSAAELDELIRAMDDTKGLSFLVTLSNADAGGAELNEIWRNRCAGNKRIHLVPSLGMKRYLTALKHSEMMIGNSSSGTTEGPAMHIPVVNVGERQKGRLFPASAIHCEAQRDAIVKAIRQALTEEMKELANKTESPFGDGKTSARMVELLYEACAYPPSLAKGFYDVDFEVRNG